MILLRRTQSNKTLSLFPSLSSLSPSLSRSSLSATAEGQVVIPPTSSAFSCAAIARLIVVQKRKHRLLPFHPPLNGKTRCGAAVTPDSNKTDSRQASRRPHEACLDGPRKVARVRSLVRFEFESALHVVKGPDWQGLQFTSRYP